MRLFGSEPVIAPLASDSVVPAGTFPFARLQHTFTAHGGDFHWSDPLASESKDAFYRIREGR